MAAIARRPRQRGGAAARGRDPRRRPGLRADRDGEPDRRLGGAGRGRHRHRHQHRHAHDRHGRRLRPLGGDPRRRRRSAPDRPRLRRRVRAWPPASRPARSPAPPGCRATAPRAPSRSRRERESRLTRVDAPVRGSRATERSGPARRASGCDCSRIGSIVQIPKPMRACSGITVPGASYTQRPSTRQDRGRRASVERDLARAKPGEVVVEVLVGGLDDVVEGLARSAAAARGTLRSCSATTRVEVPQTANTRFSTRQTNGAGLDEAGAGHFLPLQAGAQADLPQSLAHWAL